MVVYHCDHYGAFTQLLALRFRRHPNDSAVLVCSNNGERTEVLKRLEENKVFDYVISFPSEMAITMDNHEMILNIIKDFFDEAFSKKGIKIENASEIYTSTDLEGTFAFYLNVKKIKYVLMETLEGQLFDEHRYEIYLEMGTGSKEYVNLQKQYRVLTYDCEMVKKCILYPQTIKKVPDKTRVKFEVFDFDKELKRLPDSAKRKIMDSYQLNVELFRKPHCLVLPNSAGFTWQSGLPREKYALVYQLLVDYYRQSPANDSLLIKPHPYGFINFADNFENAVIIDRSFPIELLSLYSDIIINESISIHTTATSKIEGMITTKTTSGIAFFKAFRYIHKLYGAFSLARQLINEGTRFHQYVEDTDFLKSFVKQVFPELDREFWGINPNILKGNILTIIDSCVPTRGYNICNGLQNASEDAITIFLDVDNSHCFYDMYHIGLLEDMVPVRIRKCPLRKHIIENLEDEYLYIFSKKEEVRNRIRTFSIHRVLHYTGVKLSIVPMEDIEIENLKLKMRLGETEKAISDLLCWRDNIRQL